MLTRIRKAMDEREGGFTLIELLVVMIIIGILAAIAIPVFLNQKKKAAETAAKSDATAISKEIQATAVDGTLTAVSLSAAAPWTLTATTAAGTDTTVVQVSADNTPAVTFDAGAYCVTVTPANGSAWSANADGLRKDTDCTP